MDPKNAPITSTATIADLFALTLHDGLPGERDGISIRYRNVRLRETAVAHERVAVREAERAFMVGGALKLLVSDSEFAFNMTVQHIESFECDGVRIPAAAIDAALVGKLSEHDFGLIEQRVYLINLASQVRYGVINREQFDALSGGTEAAASPQPVGQAADVGAVASSAESGPSVLADFSGAGSSRAAAVDGR